MRVRKTVGTLVLVGVLMLQGCASCVERYEPFLKRVRDNLEKDVLPKYREALTKEGRPQALVDNDCKLVEGMVADIDRVREQGPPEPASAEGSQ